MRIPLAAGLLLVLAACPVGHIEGGSDSGASMDGGADDAGGDAGFEDGGLSDAGTEDGGLSDGGSTDAGGVDGGATDAGGTDGGSATADGGTDGGIGPACVGERLTSWQYEVTPAEESRMVPLSALEAGKVYRTLTLEFELDPVSWNGTCWNPFRSPPAFVPVHQSVVELSRGSSSRWCFGGNLFWSTVRGPSLSNHWVRSFYKDADDGRCGNILTYEHSILEPARQSLTSGSFHLARFELDTSTDTIVMTLGDRSWTGALDPGVRITNDGGTLHAVFSFNEWAECYDTSGNQDPSADCCWRPSTGWVYRNLSYEACE